MREEEAEKEREGNAYVEGRGKGGAEKIISEGRRKKKRKRKKKENRITRGKERSGRKRGHEERIAG